MYLDENGTLLGKRRKLMPTAAERLVWGFGDGSTMEVYDTAIGKVGAVLCWENLMPAARMAMYQQGVQLYCAPTANGTPAHHATMRHIAQEGRCFVLAANQVMRVKDFPNDHLRAFGDDPETVVSNGGSAIIGPLARLGRPRLRQGDPAHRRGPTSTTSSVQSTTSTSPATTHDRMSSSCASTALRGQLSRSGAPGSSSIAPENLIFPSNQESRT